MQSDGLDVGFTEDALFVLQNMLAAENHAEMSWISTKNDDFIKTKDLVRRDRSKLMYSLIGNAMPNAQIYCLTKHLSAVMQGYKELAARKMETKNEDEAKELLETAGRYESLVRLLIELSNKKTFIQKAKEKIIGKEVEKDE